MKYFLTISSLILVFACISCGSAEKDGKKLAELMCKIEKVEEKIETAEKEDLEVLQKELKSLWIKTKELLNNFDEKYKDSYKDKNIVINTLNEYECK